MIFKILDSFFLQIYHLDPAKLLSAPGLEWQAPLLLTDVDMLLMVEKGIRGGIGHAIFNIQKVIINT